MSDLSKDTGASGCLKFAAAQGSAIVGPLCVVAMLVLHFAKITAASWIWALLIAGVVLSVIGLCVVLLPAFINKNK